jgi:hypothetical protein
MLEKEIEAKMRKAVKKHGGIFLKFVSPSETGVPDRIVIRGGRVIFMELKQDGEQPTARQRYVHRKLRAQGADVRVVIGEKQAQEFIREVFCDDGV